MKNYYGSPIPTTPRSVKTKPSSCDGKRPYRSNGSHVLGATAVFYQCHECGSGAWGSNQANAAEIWNEGHNASEPTDREIIGVYPITTNSDRFYNAED